MKKLSVRIAAFGLVAAVLAVGSTAGAESPIVLGGTCVAVGAYDWKWCNTFRAKDGTFHYAIINAGALYWTVWVCGQGPGGSCTSSNGSRVGTVPARHCPCQATLYVNFPERIVAPVPYTGTPVGILTGHR